MCEGGGRNARSPSCFLGWYGEKQIPPLRYGMTSKWALRNDKQNAESGEVGAGDGDSGDGGGFGAEDARAEGDVGPVVLGEERHFF